MNTIISIALSQFGIKEISGKANEQTIVNFAKESGFAWVNDDETPWCSIFLNWCALKAGLSRSNSAAARSWLKVGEATTNPEIGDVVVFKRGNSIWQGHVGLFVNSDGDYIHVLGGNQSNQVKISRYPAADVLGFRKLKTAI